MGRFFSYKHSSRFGEMFLFIKCMCDISKDCINTFDEKGNKNRSQINELVEHYLVKKSS